MLKDFKKIIRHTDSRQLFKNVMSLGIIRGFDLIIPLIITPYLVHTVGLNNFGLLAFSMSIAVYFGTVIQYGFNIITVREISRAKNDTEKISKIYSSTITANWILAASCLGIFLIGINFFNNLNGNNLIYYSSIFFIIMQSIFPTWLFQGIERMHFIAIINFGTKLLYLFSLFIFINNPEDYIYVHFMNGCAMAFSVIASILIIRFNIGIHYVKPSFGEIKSVYKRSFSAFLSHLFPVLYSNSTTFLLGLFSSPIILGSFSAASMIVEALISIGRIISSAVFPYLSRNISKHLVFQKIMLTTGLIISLITMIFSSEISFLLFRSNSIQVANYLSLLSISILFAFIYLTYSTNYLFLIGLDGQATKITIIVSIIFFLIALFVIPIWQANAAVFIVLSARASMAAWSLLIYKKTKKDHIHE